MRLSKKFGILAAVTFIAAIGLGVSLQNYSSAIESSNKTIEKSYTSYLLADELRQSSDDLTRLVRTYAETADQQYRDQYMAVLDIRNGKVARPDQYHRIYWDFVAGGEATPRPATVKIPLNELMKQAGFTDAEFSLLEEAGKRSDGLVTLEVEAMDLIAGGTPETLADARRQAAAMVNSAQYHQFKANIMKPVDEFYIALEQRLTAEKSAAANAAAMSWNAVLILTGVLCLSVLLLIYMVYRRVLGGMNEINTSMSKLADGELEINIPFLGQSDEVGEMAHALETFRENAVIKTAQDAELAEKRAAEDMSREHEKRADEAQKAARQQMMDNVSVLAESLRRLADGDLDFQIDQPFAPDFEQLRHDMNTAVSKLGSTISTVNEVAARIDDGANEITMGTNDLANRTESQAASLEQTAAALEEITANVSNSTKSVNDSRQVVEQANQSASTSSDIVARTVNAMDRIEESSSKISSITVVIDEIAFQTNLLALNAGVEAARAGEAGAGFAVVAQEVRELAQRSAKAAKEIADLIQTSESEVQNGVKLVNETGDSLQKIIEFIQTINGNMISITTSSNEQAQGITEVNIAVGEMDQMTQQNASLVQKNTSMSDLLSQESNRLQGLIANFKTGIGYQKTAMSLEEKSGQAA